MESNDSREIPDRRRQTSPASLRGLSSNKAKTPKRNILVVQDDWNAKVGPDAYQHWAGGVGKFGIGETNAKGWTLLKIARNHRLALASTRTPPPPPPPPKLSRTGTWHVPNGQVHNQIDVTLTTQRFNSSINKANTRSFPG